MSYFTYLATECWVIDWFLWFLLIISIFYYIEGMTIYKLRLDNWYGETNDINIDAVLQRSARYLFYLNNFLNLTLKLQILPLHCMI